MAHKSIRSAAFITFAVFAWLNIAPSASDAKARKQKKELVQSGKQAPLLWRDPAGMPARDLFYGPGGQRDQPQGPYTFEREDLDGTSPKYVVVDRNRVKWTVKLGPEVRSETAASRLVWAAGYFANEDYFLEDIEIQNMPAHLHRGRDQVREGGEIHAVRLKRHLEGEKKIANWHWRDNPLLGTRELNGLKTVMALINNWDLKDINTAIYSEKGSAEPIYMVSDLGASFGADGITFPKKRSKDNLDAYARSTFLRRVSLEYVDFGSPGPPSRAYLVVWPPRFVHRTRLESVGRRIPRADARWMGEILSRLSAQQIRDAFRASGYTPLEIDGFSHVIENRIAELKAL